ncbi:MAG: hypothetical protein NC321_03575 [Clostridium sp.]|nr:hypothetical protein [Clostridium sp.]
MAKKYDISKIRPSLFKLLSSKREVVGQQDCPVFVQKYVETVWPKKTKKG